MAYQLPRGVTYSSQNLRQGKARNHNPPEDRQHDNNRLRQQSGGTVSPKMNRIVKELWLWCLQREIHLQAEHLAGVLNTIADEKSRVMKDRSDLMLDQNNLSKHEQVHCPSTFEILQLETRPRGSSPKLEHHSGPPICHGH